MTGRGEPRSTTLRPDIGPVRRRRSRSTVDPGDPGDPGGPADWADGVADLYRSERASAIGLATALVGDRSIAEEIVQDAFVELSRRWARLDNPAAYLRTALVNRSRSHHRRRTIRRREPPPLPQLVDEPASLELWSVLAGLPHRRRVALVLRYYVDLPVTEIAELMACRPGTVSSLLHRGLPDLRKVLTDE